MQCLGRIWAGFTILALAGDALPERYWVATAAQFNALPMLSAGDVVVLQDGNYGVLDKTLESTIADDATAQTNPVLIRAQTPGGAKITAPSQITMQGRGITLAGLDFIAGSGMLENGDSDPAWIIRTDNSSRYITLSNIRFRNCTAGDVYGNWLAIYGFNHRIEYCSFEGKNEPVANATVMFKREYDEAGSSTPRNHVLRRCWFGPREVSVTANGYETIRIGDSFSQIYEMQVTIEENVFYRSIWRSDGQEIGEPEIISNKSAGNKILHNTFLESCGQVTLRHGDRATVEGNFFLGGGAYGEDGEIFIGTPNVFQAGVRIIGTNHVVRNNYFENLQGTNLRAAICLMAGDPDFNDGDGTTGDNGYEPADYAQIVHNTFINCAQINLGYVKSGSAQPQGVKIYNNVWQGAGSDAAIVRNSAFVPENSGGNYIYEPNGKYGWTGLTNSVYSSNASPQITGSYDGYLIPSANSPLRNAAKDLGQTLEDVRGLSRPGGTNDIGCFELDAAGTGIGPLLRSEVGPEFDGGPAGTYPGPVSGLNPDYPPSGNFDLSQWYLQLPVDETNGFTGEAVVIPASVLANGFAQYPWFYTGTNGTMVFAVPHNGALRGDSLSPRCELRETYSTGQLRNWVPLEDGGLHVLDVVCTVNSVGNGKVAIGQIHGKVPNVPSVIMRYDNTVSPAQIAVSVYLTPDGLQGKSWLYFPAPDLGSPIAYQLKMEADSDSLLFSCTVNGETQSLALTNDLPAWMASTFYFKAGAYYTVTDPGATAQVSFSKLQLSRGAGLQISTAILPNGITGEPYARMLEAEGGATNLTWSVWGGILPDGLSLSTNGLIYGTPGTNGIEVFFVGAQGENNLDIQELSLAVDRSASPELAGRSVLEVTASADDGNVPGNTVDGSLATRWSAQGAGQWICYDIGVPQSIHQLKIAWHKGDVRASDYAVQASVDAQLWATIAADQVSSGSTTNLELCDIPNVSGRYVRIVGSGNNLNDWNSITEVEVWGISSRLETPIILSGGGWAGGMQLSAPSVYGASYRLQRRESLLSGEWEDVGARQIGQGDALVFSDDDSGARNPLFYRILAYP